jgi:hypothetical protein
MPDVNPLFDAEELERAIGAQAPSEAASAPPAAAGAPINPLMMSEEPEKAKTLPADAYREMPAAEVGRRALEALPGSAAGVIKGTIEPFYPENIEQTTTGLGQVAAGAVSKGAGALGFEQDPQEKAHTEAALDAVVKAYGDKYGSVEGAKKALAEDPASVLADLSSVMTLGGGAAARAPGILGAVGRLSRTAGEAIGPISGPAKAAGAAAKTVSPAVNAALSGISGTSFSSLQEAAKSGVTGDKTFWRSMSGEITPAQIVDDVRGALSEIAQDRSTQYLQGMSTLKAQQPLSFSSVDSAINRAKSTAQFGTININQKAAEAIAEIEQKVAEWKEAAQTNPMYQGIAGFDALKRAIHDIGSTNYRGTPGDKAVEIVRNAVKDEIKRVDPKYADVMEKYQDATDQLNELRKELTTNKGTVGQNLRKLLKAQNDKYKNNLLEDLAKKDPDIFAKIAGQEVAHAHGHAAGALGVGGLISMLMQDPKAFAAALPIAGLSMPKVAARTAYGTQKATSPVIEMGEALGRRYAPSLAGAQLVGSEERARKGRATGGKVQALTAARLIQMADAAKKNIGRQTEEILKAPDEHVVRALDIANKHI